MLTIGLSILASGLLVYAALHDLAARTVPNWLPAVLLLLGICARLADHSLLSGLIISGVTFVILFVIWMLGAMGGGDVKLWAATVLLIPPFLHPELTFFLRVVLFGGVLALVYLALCRIIPKPHASRDGGLLRRALRAEAWRIGRRAPVPYACAIAGGAIVTLLPLSLQH
ncbi:MAG TPA: prepilin peptidase [Acidocella sp.]|nr:prepilin peptidase [Acidocella sp.]